MVSKLALISSIGMLALLASLGIYIVNFGQHGNVPPNNTSTSVSSGTCSGTCTTLEAIISGQFQSSVDKSGTGGTIVTVRGLDVLYVRTESDGDWHVAVTDGHVPVFITEIIPRDQAQEGQPAPGAIIDETGTPFCDTYHETEAWHGNTCWEIHPVTAWHASSGGTTLTIGYSSPMLKVNIQVAQNPISRGSQQTIVFSVSDSDGPLQGASISVQITYASGYVRDFSCATLTDGACLVSWTIGSNSNPGTFLVDATVQGQVFKSSFNVTA